MCRSTPISCPDLADHGLAELEHVGLLDEAHLDVELGELGLAVGPEVLVAVAAGDLVVALHAGHHEQLLEQLGALRQGVPGPRGQAGGHQEVAGTLGGRAGQRGGLDLDEVALLEHPPGRGGHLGAQPDGVPGRVHARAAQVEVAVLEPGLLADGDPLVDLERQRGGGVEHLDEARDDLDLAGGQVGVDVAPVTGGDLADDLDDVLAAQVVRRPGQHLVARDHLHDAAGVAQVDEGHAPVVTPLRHPPGEGDGLAGVGGTQGAGLVGAEHRWSFRSVAGRECRASLRRSSGCSERVTGEVRTTAPGAGRARCPRGR